MVPAGFRPLLSMRERGLKPDGFVWLTISDERAVEWWRCGMAPEATVRASDPLGRLDLRCLVGLAVVVQGESGQALRRLADRVRTFAADVTVHDFGKIGSSLGLYWRKGMADWVPLDEWLTGGHR